MPAYNEARGLALVTERVLAALNALSPKVEVIMSMTAAATTPAPLPGNSVRCIHKCAWWIFRAISARKLR